MSYRDSYERGRAHAIAACEQDRDTFDEASMYDSAYNAGWQVGCTQYDQWQEDREGPGRFLDVEVPLPEEFNECISVQAVTQFIAVDVHFDKDVAEYIERYNGQPVQMDFASPASPSGEVTPMEVPEHWRKK